ncbi:glycosyltransferase [Actinotalea lenta]|uniref:glycosyltransferase n=1 Tax=Actinotalea lenta TaxID=3064654 RepID=UPI003D9C6B63
MLDDEPAPPLVLQSISALRSTTNPYITQLVRGLPGAALFSWRTALLGRWDVLHLHWPELVFRRAARWRTAVGLVLFALLMLRARVTRRAVVRTVHNTAPHEPGGRVERAVLALADRWTTIQILLSPQVRLPGPTPSVLIPHGDYRDWYAGHEVPPVVRGRVLVFGLIRRYKGVEDLIAAVRRSTDVALELHVVGRPADAEVAQGIRAAAGEDPRINLRLEHVDDAALAREIGEAELVVLPYRTAQNSGAALLALSLGRPVLMSDSPVSRALSAEVGPGWVQTFCGELTADVLEGAVRTPGRRGAAPDLSARGWPTVLAHHEDVYRQALDLVRRRRQPSVALVGTRGVPARYGGFETCVEEVGRRLVDLGHEVVVYSRGDGPREHLGMRCVRLPALRHRVLETLSHTALSVAHLLVHRADAVIVFNAANAPLLPLLRLARLPVATHVDGLEWQRAKWGRAGRSYYRRAERWAVRWSDALIADARGIQDYYLTRFGAQTVLLAYGAPVVARRTDRLGELGLEADGYHLVVARFEPENHVDVIVRGYVRSDARLPLVVVGSAPYADQYIRQVHDLADERVRFLGSLWDQELLDQLYAGARTYLDGHSVGGTNPSLLRAMGAGAPTVAWDVVFNREVLGAAGLWFASPGDVAARVHEAEQDARAWHERGTAARVRAGDYDWDDVARGYSALARRLAARSRGVAARDRTGGRR